MSKKKVLLRGVFINRDTNGEGVLKVGTTLIRVSTVMGILYLDMIIFIILQKYLHGSMGVCLRNTEKRVKMSDFHRTFFL